jgi:hypothetical protein
MKSVNVLYVSLFHVFLALSSRLLQAVILMQQISKDFFLWYELLCEDANLFIVLTIDIRQKSAKRLPCSHTCISKESCSHNCCKVGIEVEFTSDSAKSLSSCRWEENCDKFSSNNRTLVSLSVFRDIQCFSSVNHSLLS